MRHSLFLAADDANSLKDVLDELSNTIGINLFDEEIDQVIFRTNEFLTSGGFDGGGPFSYIMDFSMCLGAMFAVYMAAGMAYKMMVKGEAFDPLKLFRVFGIACVMFFWTSSPSGNAGVLDVLSYVPNVIGSWAHDMYEIEACQVQKTYNLLGDPMDSLYVNTLKKYAEYEHSKSVVNGNTKEMMNVSNADTLRVKNSEVNMMDITASYANGVVMMDKIVMFLSLAIFRIGWWGTIYCQQILLGMLAIFGPLQWAFSLLPKWEGSWAKWITRYLTVHFYGAMLYFVGFYVLLLFDIVFNIQLETLQNINKDDTSFTQYLTHAMSTAGYLLVASVVSLKCLNLVPDLAAWMIPEGDTAFSTRNFGEGVAGSVKSSISGAASKAMRMV